MENFGRHALVTGGGTGIGLGIAMGLAEAGAEVTITGRNLDRLQDVAATHPRLHALQMNVDEVASVQSGIAAAAPGSPAPTSVEALGSVETAELEAVEASQPEQLTGGVADSGDAQADGSGELWPPLREVSNA